MRPNQPLPPIRQSQSDAFGKIGGRKEREGGVRRLPASLPARLASLVEAGQPVHQSAFEGGSASRTQAGAGTLMAPAGPATRSSVAGRPDRSVVF